MFSFVPNRFAPGKSAPGTRLLGGLLCPRIDLGRCEKKDKALANGEVEKRFIRRPDFCLVTVLTNKPEYNYEGTTLGGVCWVQTGDLKLFRNASIIGLQETPRIIKLDLGRFELIVNVSVFGDLLPVCGHTLKETH